MYNEICNRFCFSKRPEHKRNCNRRLDLKIYNSITTFKYFLFYGLKYIKKYTYKARNILINTTFINTIQKNHISLQKSQQPVFLIFSEKEISIR